MQDATYLVLLGVLTSITKGEIVEYVVIDVKAEANATGTSWCKMQIS